MAGISISIHPLFFVLGFYYALNGGIFIFIIYTTTAVVHEIGHSLVASNLGYRLNKIKLMPFGAVVSGNIDGLKFIDQAKIALAGPLVNFVVSLFFIACWWVYPNCYAYTDVVVIANLTMVLVNLLPIYPLDGGRIVFSLLANKLGYDKAFSISRIIGLSFCLILFGTVIYGLTNDTFNPSLLFFALFVLFGTLSRERENKYVKIFCTLDEENLKRGLPVKTFAVNTDTTIKQLIALLDCRAVNQVQVYENGKKIAFLSQQKLEKLIQTAPIYSKISQIL